LGEVVELLRPQEERIWVIGYGLEGNTIREEFRREC
jgi:hypothetical protein